GRIHRAGRDLRVVRLHDHAAIVGPVALELAEHLLEVQGHESAHRTEPVRRSWYGRGVVPPRLSFVTLGVRDLPKMAAFYRSLGWPESETNNEHHIAFQLGGAVLALYGAEPYERELGPAPEPGAWKGVTF